MKQKKISLKEMVSNLQRYHNKGNNVHQWTQRFKNAWPATSILTPE